MWQALNELQPAAQLGVATWMMVAMSRRWGKIWWLCVLERDYCFDFVAHNQSSGQQDGGYRRLVINVSTTDRKRDMHEVRRYPPSQCLFPSRPFFHLQLDLAFFIISASGPSNLFYRLKTTFLQGKAPARSNHIPLPQFVQSAQFSQSPSPVFTVFHQRRKNAQ